MGKVKKIDPLICSGNRTGKNVSHFEIEKSADKTAFAKIGEIKAIGNTSDISDYTFNDASPYNGSNYYRLKITDIDGQFAYS
ncbi:hypothetical protein EMGBS15_10510, partial [Filimonas sp.]